MVYPAKMYEKMVNDLVELKFKPYYLLGVGMLIGIFSSRTVFAQLFESHRDLTVAFLWSCLLVSIKTILKECPRINNKRYLALIAGITLGYLMIGEPVMVVNSVDEVSPLILFLGGALPSSTMIIHGIPSSSVLIIMGIYDNVLVYLKKLELLKLLDKIYEKYKCYISYFFIGLIIMSTKTLLPHEFNIAVLSLFIVGFALV